MGWGIVAFGMFVVGAIVILGYALWLRNRYGRSVAPVESDVERRARSIEDDARRDALEPERRRTRTG